MENSTASECEGTASGVQCEYVCDDGWTPSGIAACFLGEWDEQTCLHDPCTANPEIEHLDSNETSCAMIESSLACEHVCNSGYHASGQAECYASRWNTTGATCDEDPCVNLTVVGLDHTATACDDTPSGSTCLYTCDQGYTATEPLATCYLGVWGNVECMANNCTDDPQISYMNGTASHCEGTAHNGICNITCASGYEITEPATCYLGSWDATNCTAIAASGGGSSMATAVTASVASAGVVGAVVLLVGGLYASGAMASSTASAGAASSQLASSSGVFNLGSEASFMEAKGIHTAAL